MSENNINIGVGADLSSFQKAINDASTQLQSLGKKLPTNDFDKLNMAARATEKDIKNLTLAYGANSDVVKDATNKYLGYKSAIDQVNQSVQSSIGVAPQLGNQVQKAAGQFNVLGNSVNQLTRELPAFTYSVQTGFMAISNNIPMFVDSINSIRQANAALAASGQPVQSVFSQVTSAIFSWNTALSLGITALTVFSPMIAEYIAGFSESADATRKAKQELDDYNKSFAKYIANGQQRAKIQAEESYNEQAKPRKIALMLLEQRLKQAKEFNLQISEEDIKSKQTLTSELIKLDQVYKDELAAIDKSYNEQKKLEAQKQAQFEVSIFEDKFTKMRESLEAFRNSDSFKAAKDLALPVFDANTINEIGDGLAESVETLIKPFVHVRTEVNNELDKTKEAIDSWGRVAAGAMAQASAQLGAAFASGDFKSAGEAIIKQLGGIAIQIGAAMLATGIPMALGEPFFGGKSLKLIAGGTALALAGGIMQSTGRAPNAGSSMAGSGGGYQSGYTPFSPMSNGGNNFTFDGIVRGSNLEIVLLNTNQQNRRIR